MMFRLTKEDANDIEFLREKCESYGVRWSQCGEVVICDPLDGVWKRVPQDKLALKLRRTYIQADRKPRPNSHLQKLIYTFFALACEEVRRRQTPLEVIPKDCPLYDL